MNSVLTLIANPLTSDHVEAALSVIEDADGPGTPDWLAPDQAVDIPFTGDPAKVENRVREKFAGAPIDLLAQPLQNRRKKLLVADMDSTIITVECIDEMADMLGLKDKVSAITESAMRGEIDFPAALKQRAHMIAGLSLADMQRVYDERIHLMPGAIALVRTMRASGAYCALVSGGFDFFTSRVREATGFHIDLSNSLAVQENALSGEISGEIVDSETKLASLHRFAGEKQLDISETLAVGDGANDLPMIKAAGLGVAYHAKPIVAEAARAKVDHGDLTALLYYQGYRAGEFVTA